MAEASAAPSPAALLQSSMDAALPVVSAVVHDTVLLPQQVLGALNAVAEIIGRVAVHLDDPEALARFRRVKLSALHKRVAKAPGQAERLLSAAGFAPAPGPGGQVEHLEWGLGGGEAAALAPALAVLVLLARVQKRVERGGPRSLQEPLESGPGLVEAALLSFGGVRLLEPRAGMSSGTPQTSSGLEGAMVRRSLVAERLPHFARAMEEFPTFFDRGRNALFDTGARGRLVSQAICRAISDARAANGVRTPCGRPSCGAARPPTRPRPRRAPAGLGDAAPLVTVPLLCEVAQIAASAALVTYREAEPQKSEQELCPSFALADSGAEPADPNRPRGTAAGIPVVALLLSSIPAFRLGIQHSVLTDVVSLREAPSFFTASMNEKQFDTSVKAITDQRLSQWLHNAESSASLLSAECRMIGTGCALDLSNDDRAVVFAVLAGSG